MLTYADACVQVAGEELRELEAMLQALQDVC
jgi:hypothetical protein